MFSKNGHTYSFQESGLQITLPSSREILVNYGPRTKLRHSIWTGALSLKGAGGRIPLSPLSTEEQKSVVLEFFRRWKLRNPEDARKAAFDYSDAQKGFVGVAFFSCLLFALPMSVALLAESGNQYYCSQTLKRSSAVGTMEVTKFKRKRKGQYLLDLSFTAPSGAVVLGHYQLLTENEADIPKSVPVVYSPENPECWSLPANLTGTEVNWPQRRYFGFVSFYFGIFFLGAALTGLVWSILRWARKRPLRKEVAEVFSL